MALLDSKTKTFIYQKRGNIQVEVGDAKQADFKPRVKLSAWDNECNVSFGLPDSAGATVSEDKSGKVSWWKQDGTKAVFYDLDDSSIGEAGGFEFEVHLPKKPASNVIELTLNAPKELEFYYQPPLTAEEIAEGCVRPENVVGSYAVYHASQSGDYSKLGGKNYKTGKAFHIYRPDATDAKGNKTWCDLILDIEKQTAIITIPQEWLDKSVFPVVVDPTFGYTSIGASSGTFQSVVAYASKASTLASGAINFINTYVRKGSNDFELANAIYSDSAGTVSAFLAQDSGNAPVTSTTPAWYQTGINYSFVPGTYWLGLWFSQSGYAYYDTATEYSAYKSATFETWPTSGSWTFMNIKASIYATYEAYDSQTVTVDTKRRVSASDSIDVDTQRVVGDQQTFNFDTSRRVAVSESPGADTLRQTRMDESVGADTRRRTYTGAVTTSQVDTKRDLVSRYYADKSPLTVHFFPTGLRISPHTLEPGKYKKGTANLTPNSSQLVNKLWVKGGKTTSDLYTQDITVGTEPILLHYSPRSPVTVTIGGVEKTLGIQNIHDLGSHDFLLNVSEKLLVPDLCTTGTGTISYKYEYPIKILLEEPDSQGQYGTFEDILKVDTDDKTLALELGYQHLLKYSQPVVSGSIEPFAGIYRPGDYVLTTIPDLNIAQYLEVKQVTYDSIPGTGRVEIKLQLESPERDLSNILKDLSKRLAALEKATMNDDEGPVEFYISREETLTWTEDAQRIPAIETEDTLTWAETAEKTTPISHEESIVWSESFVELATKEVADETAAWTEDLTVTQASLLPSGTLYPAEDLYPM